MTSRCDAFARQVVESMLADDSPMSPNAEFPDWLAERRAAYATEVRPIPFADLAGWQFSPETGDLRHDSGRFFTIEGLAVRTDRGAWSQPVINQPEIGILGIAVAEFGGVLHCLMQAKMEPGNINVVQLVPTVQATRSNYTRVHGGGGQHYLDLFTAPREVLVDSLQSEYGAWFLRKRNRNMIVRAPDGLPRHPNFRWLTLGQLFRLLQADDVVNTDARTVLSGMPFVGPANGYPGRDAGAALHWLTELRTRRELVQRTVPCAQLADWRRSADEIFHVRRRYFSVIAVEVETAGREVARWTQPLVEPIGLGLAALVVRETDGIPQLLMQGKIEAGLIDVAELAPTVQCVPANRRDQPPPYLEYVLSAPPERIRYDVILSEEGGRFQRARNRYLIVEADAELDLRPHPDHVWISLPQTQALLERNYHVNVQARTLITALHSTRVAARARSVELPGVVS